MEPPFLATDLKKLLLWFTCTLECFSSDCGRVGFQKRSKWAWFFLNVGTASKISHTINQNPPPPSQFIQSYFNKSWTSRCCTMINESEYNAYTQYLAITRTLSYTIYLLRFLWTVSSLLTGVCLMQLRLMELVYFYSLAIIIILWMMYIIYMHCIHAICKDFPLYGRMYLSSASNKQAETQGSTKWRFLLISAIFSACMIESKFFMMQAQGLPGEYEVRYSPMQFPAEHLHWQERK